MKDKTTNEVYNYSSDCIKLKTTKNRIDTPSSNYHEAWKLFRSISNENAITANHIINSNSWRKTQYPKILDVGCGDGLIMKNIAINSNKSIRQLTLLDPFPEWLNEGYKSILPYVGKNVINLEKIESHIENKIPDIYIQKNIIFAIHLVYLIEKEVLKSMIDLLPSKTVLYLVFDNSGSVFSQIWKSTNPKYYSRTIDAHNLIKSLDRKSFNVTKSEINSSLKSPILFSKDIKSELLSLLSYSNYRNLSENKKELVNKIIKDNTKNESITCESVCYEVAKVG